VGAGGEIFRDDRSAEPILTRALCDQPGVRLRDPGAVPPAEPASTSKLTHYEVQAVMAR
jgi:hypothetical protein